MGLFDMFKKAGKKAFEEAKEGSEEIQMRKEKANLLGLLTREELARFALDHNVSIGEHWSKEEIIAKLLECNLPKELIEDCFMKKLLNEAAAGEPRRVKKLERKQRSIEILRKNNVPYIVLLPHIEHESEKEPRSVEEIANRAMCLCLVACKASLSPEEPPEAVEETINRTLRDYELEPYLSPAEKLFIENKNPTREEKAKFSWRFEAYWVLLWALGYVEKLEFPDHVCDFRYAVRLMRQRTRERFISEAKLRSHSEIFDEADLIYRLHWAVRSALVILNPGVVYERHYALNWLIRYVNADWDDISTDT